jgi:phosphatidylglycerol:prolipoprotein diacylglycerol transferase
VRATAETVAPGCSHLSTMASFSSSVKLRRLGRPSPRWFSRRMKSGAPVDLNLAALEKIAPAPQADRRDAMRGGAMCSGHSAPGHRFNVHRPERLNGASGGRCLTRRPDTRYCCRGNALYGLSRTRERMIHIPTTTWAHTVFDLAAWTSGVAMSVALYRWRLKVAVEHIATKVDGGYFLGLAAGAAIGAWLAGSANSLVEAQPVLSHSVVGALVGAIVAVEIYKAIKGVRGSTGGVFVGSFALGIVVGRFGCLFAGLPDRTYGTETSLPWGVDLGDGIARHPVQMYESAAMAAFLALYLVGLQARADWAMRRGFYVICAYCGVQRFFWEFLKPYPKLIGQVNLFQLLCLGLIAYGWLYFVGDQREQRRAQERAVSGLGPDHQPM